LRDALARVHCQQWTEAVHPGTRDRRLPKTSRNRSDNDRINVVNRIVRNTTNRRSVMLTGRVIANGTCRGAQYTDGYGSWDNVVAQAIIKIILRTFRAAIKKTTNEIALSSGTRCVTSARTCTDSDGLEIYWAARTSDSCHFDQYDILYEGIASKLYPKTNGMSPTIYTVTKNTIFALTKTNDFNLCGYVLLRIKHPKLLILETQRGHTFKTRTPISVDNLDSRM